MSHLDFKTCLADPDVWMMPEIKLEGNKCYEHALFCIDDVLVVRKNAASVLRD